eukprot:scaffold521_cov167-Amphora_coffeaeformis.AAC.21
MVTSIRKQKDRGDPPRSFGYGTAVWRENDDDEMSSRQKTRRTAREAPRSPKKGAKINRHEVLIKSTNPNG